MRTGSIKVLKFIADYRNEHSYGPNFREMEDALGISTSVIHYHLEPLRDAGYVDFKPTDFDADRIAPNTLYATEEGLAFLEGLEDWRTNAIQALW